MSEHINPIQNAMARAFFASAWADQCEEAGQSSLLSGKDIMQIMPNNIDPAALHAAVTLTHDLINAMWPKTLTDQQRAQISDEQALRVLFRFAQTLKIEGRDRVLTPELFGHYLAMQAMGTGVGLESFGPAVAKAFRVPYVEFGGYSLERSYFNEASTEP
jgi:hypothetical protein